MLRQRIERRFAEFGHLIYRRHWIALLLMALLVALPASQLPKLHMDTSTEGFLRESDPTLIAYNAFREQYGRDELVLVAIHAPDVFAPEFLDDLKALHEELAENVPHLDDITSLINARNTRGAANELIVEDLLEDWPQDDQARADVRARALANPVYRNLLLSEDGTSTAIVIKTNVYSSIGQAFDVLASFDEPAEPGAGAPPRPFLTDAENSELVNAVRIISARYDGPSFRIHLGGSAAVNHVLKKSMQENMRRFMVLAVLAIAAVLYLLFRRLSGVVLPLLTVGLSLFSTLGLMAAANLPIKLPTQILPSFLLAVGVGASVHLLAVFYRRLQQLHHDDGAGREPAALKEQAIAYALGHSGLAIVMTSLTTAAGLASFAGAPVAPISDLGIVAALGVLISLVFTLVMVPALLSVTPLRVKTSARAQNITARMDRLLLGIADFSTRRCTAIVAVSALLIIVGLTGALRVNFSHKPFEWLPPDEPVRQATDFMDKHMKGTSVVEVVVDTGIENGLYEPAFLQGLERLTREVEGIDQGEIKIGKALSLTDILKEINRALNENRAEYYAIPDDKQLIAQELLLFENSGSDDLEDFVDARFSQTRLTAKMPWVDAIYYGDLITDLQRRFHAVLGDAVAVSVTGMSALLGRTMHATILTMGQSYVIAAVVITLLMILLIGDLRIGLLSMLPNLTPIVLTLGLMGWLGLPLDLFTMLIGSIAIGLAVDDTIHFMHNYRRYHQQSGDVAEAVRRTLLTTGRAMFVTTVVLSIGFFLFMFSTLSNLFNFGLLTGFTIIVALLADFFMAPALLAQLHKSGLLGAGGEY